MKFVKAKFLKDGQPAGRAYTYRTELDLKPGELVELPGGRHGVIVNEPIDQTLISTYGADNLKEIVKKEEGGE